MDDQRFRDLMAFIEPEYTVPSWRTITARVERMLAEKRELLKLRAVKTGITLPVLRILIKHWVDNIVVHH